MVVDVDLEDYLMMSEALLLSITQQPPPKNTNSRGIELQYRLKS
jgi:hypothetical protein